LGEEATELMELTADPKKSLANPSAATLVPKDRRPTQPLRGREVLAGGRGMHSARCFRHQAFRSTWNVGQADRHAGSAVPETAAAEKLNQGD
jgi:hypothetical protein